MTPARDRTPCQRCKSPIEAGDLRCPICAAYVPDDDSTVVATVEIARCDGCGAALRYDPVRGVPRCNFCGEPTHVEGIEDPVEQTEWWLDFTVTPEQARNSVRAWLGTRGFLRPGDLRSASQLDQIQPMRWVAWTFSGTALCSWTGDSNLGARRSRWAPHSGQVEIEFSNVLVPASRGLSLDECHEMTPSYDLHRGGAAASPLPGHDASIEEEYFDVQRSAARQAITESAQAIARAQVSSQEIPGSAYRNVHVELFLRKMTTRRCALPVYILPYRYGGRLYRTVVSGHDAQTITGSAPLSALRVALLITVIVAVIAGLAALLLHQGGTAA